jgi:outer membrane protein
VNGNNLGGADGLTPNTQDYALGFSVTFPLFDRASIRAKEAGRSAEIRAETARAQLIATEIKARWNAAVATLSGARKVAANIPVQVTAARAATDQATARYQAGLGNVDAVAEAQRLLTQAEIDGVLARLSVWRSLLNVATVAGDLQPFLSEASQ